MEALRNSEVIKLSELDLNEIRERVFFSKLILPQAKSDSLIAIFKLEHGQSIGETDLSKLNAHLRFIGSTTI